MAPKVAPRSGTDVFIVTRVYGGIETSYSLSEARKGVIERMFDGGTTTRVRWTVSTAPLLALSGNKGGETIHRMLEALENIGIRIQGRSVGELG